MAELQLQLRPAAVARRPCSGCAELPPMAHMELLPSVSHGTAPSRLLLRATAAGSSLSSHGVLPFFLLLHGSKQPLHGRARPAAMVPRNFSSASLFIFLPAVTPRFFPAESLFPWAPPPLQLPLAGAQKSQQHAPSPRVLSARRNAAASSDHEIPSVLLASARSAQSRPKASRGCLDSPTLRRRSARFDRLHVSLRQICAAPTSTPFTPVRRR
jgi:hypothetical protein